MPAVPSNINPEEPSYRLYEGIEYSEFWNRLRYRKLDVLEHAIVRKLLPVSGRRIIDVGCGYGRLADCYMGSFQQVIMVDGSMSLLRQAVEMTGGQATYIASDVAHLPFQTASFDAVLMIRVFHHIEDSKACLSELHRIQCDGGRFVFGYRNKQSALRVIQWLIGTQKENPLSKEPAGVGSTLISHHPKAVHRMLRESGFSKIQYSGAGVVDWLAEKIGFASGLMTLDVRLAPFFGRTKIAPWIFCGSVARGNKSLIDTNEITDLLQCPCCRGILIADGLGYLCGVCNSYYPIEDGIIDFRV